MPCGVHACVSQRACVFGCGVNFDSALTSTCVYAGIRFDRRRRRMSDSTQVHENIQAFYAGERERVLRRFRLMDEAACAQLFVVGGGDEKLFSSELGALCPSCDVGVVILGPDRPTGRYMRVTNMSKKCRYRYFDISIINK